MIRHHNCNNNNNNSNNNSNNSKFKSDNNSHSIGSSEAFILFWLCIITLGVFSVHM